MVSDCGALESIVALLIAALTTMALAILAIFGVHVAHERLQGAADLSALAAASDGGCDSASVVAQRNAAELVTCEARDGDVRVVVRLPKPDRGLLRFVPEGTLRARAHAAAGDVPQAP